MSSPSEASRTITVVLLRLKPDEGYFTHSPKLPKTLLTLEVNHETTVDYALVQLMLVYKKPKYSLNTDNTLAFFFKHKDGKDVICRMENGGVLNHSGESMQTTTVLSLDCDKIVFVEKKLQEKVNETMALHFKIHQDVWRPKEDCSMSLQDIFKNNCELMVSPSPANRNCPALFHA